LHAASWSNSRDLLLTTPITSAAIFGLIEIAQLQLTDKVFGPPVSWARNAVRKRIDNPMFRFNSWDHAKLISRTLEYLPLAYPPRRNWSYSNFGYCVLGSIIEQMTGQVYADYVQSNILAPCGISDMRIFREYVKPTRSEWVV
jgi:hypothetical protein